MSSSDNNATLKRDRCVFMTQRLLNLDRHRPLFFLLYSRLETPSSLFWWPGPYQFPHLTLTLGALINWGYTCHRSGREGHVEGLISTIWAV